MSLLAEDVKPKTVRGVDATLILEPGQKRHRSHASPEQIDGKPLPSTRGRHGSADPSVIASTPATDAAGLEEIRRKGLYIYEKLTSMPSVLEGDDQPAHVQFMYLPSRVDYPSYYDVIKKPISFLEIKQRLDKADYTTIAEVRLDFNQVFINAKRFNAPGSPIFLNAKQLHKLLKSTYGQLTGDHALPADDDDYTPPTAPSPGPSASTHHSRPVQIPGTSFAKRGPTLKPWLTRKLFETMDLRDSAGRSYAEAFKSLPDKKTYPEYYQVITHPMSFDNIQAKVVKRAYTTVQQFVEDVDVMLANALYFNEEVSRIWKDARVLQNHFAEVMKEVPPVFVPPRKYNTARRRAEQQALAAGLPLPVDGKKKRRREGGESEPPEGQSPAFNDGESGDDYDEDGYGSQNGKSQYAPSPGQYDYPMAEPDAFAPASRARSMTPAAGLQSVPPYAIPPLASPIASASGPFHILTAPSQLVQSPGIFAPSPSPFVNSPSPHLAPLPNGNGLHSPLAEASPSSDPPKPRLIAKLPKKGDVPAISRFLVRTAPSTLPMTLDNALVRQHSFAVQASTARVDFTPFFGRGAANGKGKGKEGDVVGAAATPFLKPLIKVTVRPNTTTFETLAELPSPDGPTHRYSLVPKPGLTVVEFVVTPRPGAGQGDSQAEVYRVFVTRPESWGK